MIKNYLTITWRSLKKNKIYSFINIFGLAVGMSCCIVIMLFVQDELSFDRFHENAQSIYRLTVERKISTGERRDTLIPSDAAPNLIAEFPEVVDAARMAMPRVFVVEHGDKRFTTDPVGADPNILEVFTFPLIMGDKRTALKDPDNVVISEDLASKMFADENPMGKVITLYGVDTRHDYQVTGIMRNIPHNSHLRFEFLTPASYADSRKNPSRARREVCVTYLLLGKNADPQKLEEKFPGFVLKHYGEQFAKRATFHLQPLTSIHLRSDLDYDEIVMEKGNISTSYFLSAIAFMILLIACINFMNLSTARATRRSREVGIRRVVGAFRNQLFRQFLGESIQFAFIALLFALAMASILLPYFNSLMGKHLTIDFKANLFLYSGLFFLSLFVGLLSGSYPAFFLSSYRPVDVLKGEIRKGTRFGVFLRKGLVVFQFAVSLVFIIGTIIIYWQIGFIKNKDLGFVKENIISIPIFKDKAFSRRSELIIRELGQHPNVLDVIVTLNAPGGYNGWLIPCVPQGFSEENPIKIRGIHVGEGHFDFFGIPIVEGRNFSAAIASDADSAVIINQTAVTFFGWESPVGKMIKCEEFRSASNKEGVFSVIGVVKDFHNGSLHEKIEPTAYKFYPQGNHAIYLKIRPENIQETIAFLERKWRELPTYLIFHYQFLDERIQIYRYGEETKISKVFSSSSILAVLLACLGVFGLASFSSEQRVKEIGIRKVLGASVENIVLLLSKDFSKLVLMANIIAWPIAYYVLARWMQNFAYRVGIGWWIFPLAALMVLIITFLTIGYHAIKAAHTNPAVTLRYE
jgi:putative ABC transport system permease protein